MRHQGTPPAERMELARIEDRVSFLYAEHCVVHRQANALTITDQRGVVHVPAAGVGVVLLGPGTRITHSAMSVLGDCGVSVAWVGEHGVRYYASGRPLAKSARLAEAQARIVSNQRSRLACARAMYAMRFPGEDVSTQTMTQLRGREGARMKKVYASEAARTGVSWTRRAYDPNDFEGSDDINRALTAASAALYGVAHAVICSLGCVPSLGVVHAGTDRSFVYDIADLYKAETAIPAAFDAVSGGGPDPAIDVRRLVRDRVVESNLISRMSKDIHALLDVTPSSDADFGDLLLWSELQAVPTGVNWSDAEAFA